MAQGENKKLADDFVRQHAGYIKENTFIDKAYYKEYDVKRGLRNADGTGVMVDLTRVGDVRGYYMQDGEKMPMPGQLIYRGIDVADIVSGFMGDRKSTRLNSSHT